MTTSDTRGLLLPSKTKTLLVTQIGFIQNCYVRTTTVNHTGTILVQPCTSPEQWVNQSVWNQFLENSFHQVLMKPGLVWTGPKLLKLWNSHLMIYTQRNKQAVESL